VQFVTYPITSRDLLISPARQTNLFSQCESHFFFVYEAMNDLLLMCVVELLLRQTEYDVKAHERTKLPKSLFRH